MNIDKLRDIFIEEANEIIEKLDVDIIHFEEAPSNKELLNELFRGVHTLKGSANSFGFTRLGEFVHHFEDVLDLYRNSNITATTDTIDLFLEAVDIIKEVMFIETDGIDELPENYASCLTAIKAASNITPNETSDTCDITEETFTKVEETSQKEPLLFSPSSPELQTLQKNLLIGEKLFKLTLMMDEDLFTRGLDQIKLIKALAKKGHILESYWDLSAIPKLNDFHAEKNAIPSITLYVATKEPKEELEKVLEYFEYTLEPISTNAQFMAPPENQTKEEKPKATKPTAKRKTENNSFVKINTMKLDELFDSIGELVIAQNFLAENPHIKNSKNEEITKTLNTLSKITRSIQTRVMSLRMVPIQEIFEKMKRISRDAAKRVNKEINLVIEGADTEIDKTMIDALSDPLAHLIRNAIDHGIEDDAVQRMETNKDPIGQVTLKAYHRGGSIAIEIMDDGQGIDKTKVKAKAVERHLIAEDQDLTDAQVFNLLLQPGFSTAQKLSDISGRGVGLDIVHAAIEKLNGKIDIDSKEGEGTTFTIILPLTMAIIDGMVIKSENDTFIIPTLSVIESFIPLQENVHTLKHKGEFIDLRGEMLPIIRLNHLLEIGTSHPHPWESTIICIESEKGKYALQVDDLVGHQQVVIKPLGAALANIKEISGSAIMGNGEIALILNTEALFRHEGTGR